MLPGNDPDNDTPTWVPGWMPDKTTLNYMATCGTVLALLGLFTYAALNGIKGGHLSRIGMTGIGGAGT